MSFESGGYAPGTEFNPNAPWNEPEDEEVEVCVSLTISKNFKVKSSGDIYDAVDRNITLPNDLAAVVKTAFDSDLDLKAAGMPLFLKYAIDNCSDWNIDDCEIIPE
jgi:hypothetical protein